MKHWPSIAVAILAVFALAYFDAWRMVGLPTGTSLAIAAVPALVLSASFLFAIYVGRTTGRRPLMGFAAATVAVVGIIGYGRYVLVGPGTPDDASQMHVVFFPLGLALFAALIMAICAGIARSRPQPPVSGLQP
jgi:hypothetical protein